VKVAEQLVQADDEQTAQFDEQAWHPETAVTYVAAHWVHIAVLLWNQQPVIAVPVWHVPFETK
jgi:hypothetical protein